MTQHTATLILGLCYILTAFGMYKTKVFCEKRNYKKFEKWIFVLFAGFFGMVLISSVKEILNLVMLGAAGVIGSP